MARTNAAHAAGIRTRETMLDAAVELFAAKGFRGASVDDIARRADVTRSSLLYHFGSKEGILLAVLERRDAEVQIGQDAGLPPTGSGSADLLARVRMRSPGIRARIDAMKLAHVLEAEAAAPEHPAREWVAKRSEGIRTRFAADFASDLEGSGSGLDAASMAAITLAVINGLESQWLVDPDSIDFDRALEVYETLVLRAVPRGDGPSEG